MPKPLIIFDLNRTLYDPEQHQLMDGAHELLQTCLDRGYVLALVSRNETNRDNIIDEFKLRPFFSRIELVEQKTAELFIQILNATGAEASKSFAIGDVVSKEIAIGNSCGFNTIWFRAGKFMDLTPTTPDEYANYVVRNLWEVLPLLPIPDVT